MKTLQIEHFKKVPYSIGRRFSQNYNLRFLAIPPHLPCKMRKRRGKTIGRPRKSDENLDRAFTMYESKKYTLYDIKEATGISKSTLYRYLDSRSTSLSDEKNSILFSLKNREQ